MPLLRISCLLGASVAESTHNAVLPKGVLEGGAEEVWHT